MNSNQAIERVRDVMRRQHKALSTEQTYLFWLRRYIRALAHMPNGLTSEKKIEQFLIDLARKYDVSTLHAVSGHRISHGEPTI